MTIKHPERPLTKATFRTIPSGNILHRVHQSVWLSAGFNHGFGEMTRFAHFRNSDGVVVPSLYAASTMRAAIHETIFNNIAANSKNKVVFEDRIIKQSHSILQTNRPLNLVELKNPDLSRWKIRRRELIETSSKLYRETVLWAKAIHDDFDNADGLIWTSSQCDPDESCIFFGDRVFESDFSVTSRRIGVLDGTFLLDVHVEASKRGVIIVK